MILNLLKDGKLLNRVVVPDDWPDCVDPWMPDPAAGLTWEVEGGSKEYEAYVEPPAPPPPPDPNAAFEALKARAMEAMLDYMAKQPDAPEDIKAWDKARKGG